MKSWCMLALLLLASLSAAGPVLLLPQDCQELYRSGVTSSGVYTIYPSPSTPVDVYCEISCDDDCDAVAGWTVIQKRMDGSVGFYRNWETYKNGFGNKSGEYWLGLDNLHLITNNKLYELRIDLEDFDGLKSSAVYTTFIVGPESNSYTLRIGGFINHGAGDSLSYHNGQKFSTYDNENNNYGYYCGLDSLHLMTNNKLYELQVDLEDFDGQKASAVYKVFIVGPETNGYVLRIGGFVNYGAGDSVYR
ncbi:microfibril-associated glycoprotein 4-like [Clarias magur]|uniref:Microfibril-associated glycoprotein 4-like n=1 Tax=Clarias magur TaxID=1594786 RepID=A0A8J4X129_CLAMG|nr:microfibril-associated glycoprotein 4-like [Clarias magur]